ncbi:MAG: PAS domain S-box protein [Candidatus Binatia bacterium]
MSGRPSAADDRYQDLFRQVPIGLYRTSPDGTILAANPALAELLGYTIEELVGTRAADLYASPEERPAWLEKVRTGGVVRGQPMRFRRRDGEVVWARNSVRAVYDDEGRVIHYDGALEDLSEQKRAERTVEESEERYRQLVEHSPQAIAVHSEGKFVYVNPAAVRLMGARVAEDLLGRPALDVVHPDSRELVIARMLRMRDDPAPLEAVEETLLRLDGSQVVVETTAIPTTYLGKPAVQVVVNDITGRKRADEELRAALRRAEEADHLKSAFLANMSHEVRTPLNVILGYGQLIESHLHEIGDQTQRALFDGMNRAAWRLMNTVHGVLDLSRLVSGSFPVTPIPVRLAPIITHQVEEIRPAAEEKGLSLALGIEETAVRVRFDEYCLSQALKHLLDNAVKFTARGGVAVTLRRDADQALVLDVRDTGIGIDRRHLDRLFTPFWQEQTGTTRPFEGSGLGLALTRRYLELNGAGIQARSEKGGGTTFTIRFPADAEVREGAVEASAASGARDTPDGTGPAAVLVVEDDPETQLLMKRFLSRRYRVLVAATAAEARYLLGAYAEEVRVILMDLALKGPEDGLALTRDLRTQPRWRTIPIIATTAHVLPDDRQNALSAGCDLYLPKPVQIPELMTTLERLVG